MATTKKTAAPKNLFSKDQVVFASHPRLHPAEAQATVLADYADQPKVTFIRLQFVDAEAPITVHKGRIKLEATPAAA